MIRPVFVIPVQNGKGIPQEVSTFEAFDKLVADALTAWQARRSCC